MNNAKHTQGPWAVDHAFGVGPVSDSDDQSYGMVLAVADIYGDNRVVDSRLIAAAPELLEALELISRYIEPTAVDAASMQKVARAAIAKATGAESSVARPAQGMKP